MESFNGRLRDESLNETVFTTQRQARAVLAAWREDYNHVRPHSARGGRAPGWLGVPQCSPASRPLRVALLGADGVPPTRCSLFGGGKSRVGIMLGKRFIGDGHAHLRQALYRPALLAVRFNADTKQKSKTLVAAEKPKEVAVVAVVAVMGKLVALANALLRDQRN